ncbi:MAG: hypothetical protein JSR82_04495 [Verrucomicrobia bacterium]|nr:hypothetical protein [Verrucomicrobiota bacterium]
MNDLNPTGRMLALALLGLTPAALPADVRSSANYSVAAEVVDGGGRRTSGGVYTNDATIGGLAGLSTVTTPALTAKHGYAGQLFDVASLSLAVANANVNETANRQVNATAVLDDGSTLTLGNSAFTWSIVTGPLSAISSAGLATAGVVYQDTSASVQATYAGVAQQLTLNVVNSNLDNFGTYAGDGIDDAWQVQYFGLNNPQAGPTVDVDGDGQNNLFEYTAGTVPNQAGSRFALRDEAVPGQPTQKRIIFSPRLTDRTYVVQFATDLALGNWQTLTNLTTSDNGQERTVTDLGATGAKRFYRVQVTKP